MVRLNLRLVEIIIIEIRHLKLEGLKLDKNMVRSDFERVTNYFCHFQNYSISILIIRNQF